MARILLVEDNRHLGDLVSKALRLRGFVIDHVTLVDEAETALSIAQYDAVVLDLGLPDRDGMTLLKPLRASASAPAVLVLTSRDESSSVIEALDNGADDYLTKPFVMGVLVARLRALLRRPNTVDPEMLAQRNIELDPQKFLLRIAGNEIPVSRREFAALELFMRRASRVISKEELQESIYGMAEDVSLNAVEVLVHRLRKKLETGGAEVQIHNLRGLGYLLADRND